MYRSRMGLEWEQVVVATSNPAALGRRWCEALGWVVVDDDPPVFEIQPQPDRLPGILFLADPDGNEFCLLQSRRATA